MQPLASSSRSQKASPYLHSQGNRIDKGNSRLSEELPLSQQILGSFSYGSISIPDSSDDDDLPGPESYMIRKKMSNSATRPSQVPKPSSSSTWQSSTVKKDIDWTQRRTSGSNIGSSLGRTSKPSTPIALSTSQSQRLPHSTSSLSRQTSRSDLITPKSTIPKPSAAGARLSASQVPSSSSSEKMSRRGELLARHRQNFATTIPRASSSASSSSSSSAEARPAALKLSTTPSSQLSVLAGPSPRALNETRSSAVKVMKTEVTDAIKSGGDTEEAETVEIPSLVPSTASPLVPSLTAASRPRPATQQPSATDTSSTASSSKSAQMPASQGVSRTRVPKPLKVKSRQPICIDLTEDSPPPPPRMSSQRMVQSKLVFSSPKRRVSRPPMRGSGSGSGNGKGSFDDPLVLTPTPSPTKPTIPLPSVRASRPDSPPTSPIVALAERPQPSTPQKSRATAEDFPPSLKAMDCSLSAASAAVDSPVVLSAKPSPVAMPEHVHAKRRSSSPLSEPETSPRPTKKRGAIQSVPEETNISAPQGRSLRKRPAAGFFTMPKPGTSITLWPQHAKSELLSPRKQIKVPAEVVSPTVDNARTPRTLSRPPAKQGRLRQMQVEKDSEDQMSISLQKSRSSLRLTRQGSKPAARLAVKEEYASPQTQKGKGRMVYVEIERRSTSRALTATPRQQRAVPATGSLDSPVRGLTTPVRRRSETSPLTPLSSRRTRSSATKVHPLESPAFKHLSKSARKRLDAGEIIPSSVLGEQSIWSSPTPGSRAVKVEVKQDAALEEDDDVLALDPYGDFDFFDEEPQSSAVPAALASESGTQSAHTSPVKTTNGVSVLTSSTVKQEVTDESACNEAEVKAARLQKIREQIQERAKAEAKAEADEAARIKAAADAALPAQDDVLELSDDDLDEIRSARQSAVEAKAVAPAFSPSPSPEPIQVRVKPTKQSIEVEHMMRQIAKKRKNGETAGDLIRLISAAEDLAGRELPELTDPDQSPSKRARHGYLPGPYPTPISGGAQSPTDHTDQPALSSISEARMKDLLGDDADLLQNLVSSEVDGQQQSSSGGVGDWPGFWLAEMPQQIGEPVIPSFEGDRALSLLTEAAVAADTNRLTTLLSCGIVSVGCDPEKNIALSRWLFEVATLSREAPLACAAFTSLHEMVSSGDNPFGTSDLLLQLLQQSITSFGARSTTFVGEPAADVMSYSMEASRRTAAAELWIRLVDISVCHGHLSSSAVRSLIPALVQLAMDRTTPAALKAVTGLVMAHLLSSCNESDQASICSDLTALFSSFGPEVHAAAVQAVGRATSDCRRLARWLAASALAAAGNHCIPANYQSVPPVEDVLLCLHPLADAIDNDDPSDSQMIALSSLFTETVTDVEALVLLERRSDDNDGKDKRSSVDQLCRKLVRIQGRINDNKGENVPMSMVKSRLYNLSVSVDRQRVFFERKHQWTAPVGGPLERGVGGQTRLSFGGIS